MASRFHAAQVEKQLALRLGGRDLDQPPVAQYVFVDLCLDPVQRERNQAHAALRVEAPHRLHQADVSFLDQVRLRQPVAKIIAADGDHQTQMGQHQLASGVQVVVTLQPASKLDFLRLREKRKPVYRLDVMIEAPQRCRGRECQGVSGHLDSLLWSARILALDE